MKNPFGKLGGTPAQLDPNREWTPFEWCIYLTPSVISASKKENAYSPRGVIAYLRHVLALCQIESRVVSQELRRGDTREATAVALLVGKGDQEGVIDYKARIGWEEITTKTEAEHRWSQQQRTPAYAFHRDCEDQVWTWRPLTGKKARNNVSDKFDPLIAERIVARCGEAIAMAQAARLSKETPPVHASSRGPRL